MGRRLCPKCGHWLKRFAQVDSDYRIEQTWLRCSNVIACDYDQRNEFWNRTPADEDAEMREGR